MKSNFKQYFVLTIVWLIATAASVVCQTGWSIVPQNQFNGDLNTIYFADSKRGWIGGDAGFLAATTDGGRTWTKLALATQNSISDVYFRGAEKGYLIAGSSVFSSLDGGQSWREERVLRAEAFGKAQPELYSIRFSNKKNGWIVGSLIEGNAVVGSLVLHTTDEGGLWRRVRVETKNELIHLDFINEKRGWIVGANGTILTTNDGGQTWQTQNAGTGAALYHVDFKNEDLGWIVGEKGLILRTEDGGVNWQTVSSNTNKTLLTVEFINDRIGFAAGRNGVLLRSADGGRTWLSDAIQVNNNIFAIFADKKQTWAVGSGGAVLRFDREDKN